MRINQRQNVNFHEQQQVNINMNITEQLTYVSCMMLKSDSVHFIQQNGKPKFSQKDVTFETGSTAPEWNLIEMTR